MKFLKFLLTISIIIGGIGYAIYHYGTDFISNKAADAITAEIDDEEKLHVLKNTVNNNPVIREFIEEGANVDESDLPFTTKEEAIKTIVQNIGISELQKLQTKYQGGITPNEIQELV